MWIERLARKRFLVIGRVGMDLTPDPPDTRIEDATMMMVAMGGSSANIAAGLSRLGCHASLLSTVSDDAVGRYCLDQLDRYGIDRTHVRSVRGECRTSLAVYETRMQEPQSVIYRNNAADFQMSVEDVDDVAYAGFGGLITTGTVLAAEPSRSAAFRAFDLAREAGLPIILDIDYRPYSWPSAKVAEETLSRAGAMADVVIGNDEEFGFMAGHISRGLEKARALAGSSAKMVVYKRGPEGSIAFVDGEEIRTGIFPADAIKPTGAGDSFMAGLMASLADGLSFREAILRGSACASLVVSRPGCAPAMPRRPELDAFLASRNCTFSG